MCQSVYGKFQQESDSKATTRKINKQLCYHSIKQWCDSTKRQSLLSMSFLSKCNQSNFKRVLIDSNLIKFDLIANQIQSIFFLLQIEKANFKGQTKKNTYKAYTNLQQPFQNCLVVLSLRFLVRLNQKFQLLKIVYDQKLQMLADLY